MFFDRLTMAKQVSVTCYLTRLPHLGVGAVHGVPGAFSPKVLDQLKPVGIKWISYCNELNPGCAADVYARVKGISALFTLFGVEEMSAYNAMAASSAEYSAVVHVVGTLLRRGQDAKVMVHHSLDDGNLNVHRDIYQNVSVAQADLMESGKAPAQIVNVL